MSKDRPVNRRSFFREGLRELLRPLADTIADKLDAVAREFARVTPPEPAPEVPPYTPAEPYAYDPAVPSGGPWLRPPSAAHEALFRETCIRSGQCVSSCPVQAIRIDHSGAEGDGLPYIKSDETACALCDGLICMQNCPSGALTPMAREQISMGVAEWQEDTCERTGGGDCTACVDQCPIGASAIIVEQNRIAVLSGCVGCGICEQVCPTAPRSIRVKPKG